MKINKLELKQFRCFKSLQLDFDPKVNILCGLNASGKTTIIDAILFLMILRTTSNAKDKDLISFEEKEYLIKGSFSTKNGEKSAIVLNSNNTRKMSQNGVEIKLSSNYIDFASVVSFNSKDIGDIINSPSSRRKMIDVVLCQVDHYYLVALKEYKKIIKEKNALLKSETIDLYLFEILTKKQYELSSLIESKRIEFLNSLNVEFKKIHLSISSTNEIASIKLITNFYKKDFFERCKKDLIFKTATCGPHRDDYLFSIDSKDVNLYASQGQLKTMTLSFKLACINLLRDLKQEEPIILLDDVFGELDEIRQNELIKFLLNKKNQVFITTPSIGDIDKTLVDSAKIIYLNKGGLLYEQ